MFIKKLLLKENPEGYLNNLPVINFLKETKEIEFNKPITFFVGENGTGKSTLLEAIAIAYGFNAEGGTKNFRFSTENTHSELFKHITLVKNGINTATDGFFLRAESFYNLASEIERLGLNGYGLNSLHSVSHGEAFIQLVQNRFTKNGLYILDEPEAALSPSRQMTLLCLINELAKEGSQFIIATHSPILISYRDGDILDLNNNFKKIKYEDTDIYKTYKLYLDKPYEMQHHLFD
jgi:predicted ATPase